MVIKLTFSKALQKGNYSVQAWRKTVERDAKFSEGCAIMALDNGAGWDLAEKLRAFAAYRTVLPKGRYATEAGDRAWQATQETADAAPELKGKLEALAAYLSVLPQIAHAHDAQARAWAMTQQALADEVGIHVTQLRRYEAGTAQPTADVLRRLAIALRTSADTLLFDEHERGPDDELRLQFEAITRLDPDEKQVIREVVESMLIKHESKRWIKAG